MAVNKVNSSGKSKERDPDLINAEIAMQRAAKRARKRANQTGVGVVFMQDGKIVEEQPEPCS